MLEDDLDQMTRAAREINFDLLNTLRDHATWSRRQFGADDERGPLGPIRHLRKECDELEAAPRDLTEYADAFMLLMDALRRAGFSLSELIAETRAKLNINKARDWPADAPADAAIEHL